MTQSQPSPDSGYVDGDSLIAVVDYNTGRIVRIPGIYPWQERVMSIATRPLTLGLAAVALFVLLGLFAPLAFAKVIGVVDSPPGRIEISDESGMCMGAARAAAYVAADGTKTPGCWTGMQGGLFVVFLDGEIARIPMSAIKPATDS